MRVLVIGALPSSLKIFRGSLLRDMVAQGHQVWACANGYDSFSFIRWLKKPNPMWSSLIRSSQ